MSMDIGFNYPFEGGKGVSPNSVVIHAAKESKNVRDKFPGNLVTSEKGIQK